MVLHKVRPEILPHGSSQELQEIGQTLETSYLQHRSKVNPRDRARNGAANRAGDKLLAM